APRARVPKARARRARPGARRQARPRRAPLRGGAARVKRCALVLALLTLGMVAQASAPPPARTISDAITEIDLERARHLLEVTTGDATALALERGRLAIYAGDCDAAQAQLSAPTLTESKEGASLSALAKGCARATAAGLVLEDREHGITLRLQDDADRVLAPYLFRTAARARDAVAH